MDRPHSQLENVRPSGLKPPSKLPALAGSRTLQETTSSDLNTRSAGPGSMAPPTTSYVNGIFKHKITGCTSIGPDAGKRRQLTPAVPEPPTKQRKTLVERAGEPVGAQSRVKTFSNTTGGFGTRPATSHNSYRATSNASNTSSIGSIRGAFKQANGLRQPTLSRPASVANLPSSDFDQESDSEGGSAGKRKGTPTISFNSTAKGVTVRKTRTHHDLRNNNNSQPQPAVARAQLSGAYSSDGDSSVQLSGQSSRQTSASSTSSAPSQQQDIGGPVGARQTSRNVSLIAAFEGLSLTPNNRVRSRHRPSLDSIEEVVSPTKIPKYSCQPSLRHAQSAQSLRPAQFTQTLRTPSPTKQKHFVPGLRTPVTGAKSREMPIYLTKEKLTPVAAWDTKGRLDDMEVVFQRMQQQMQSKLEGQEQTKSALEEKCAMYEMRVQELKEENRELTAQTRTISSDLERARNELHTTSSDLRQVRRDQEREMVDLERKHERELLEIQMRREKEELRLEREREKESDRFAKEMEEAQKAWERRKDSETADLTSQHWDEMEAMRIDHDHALSKLQKEIDALQQASQSRASESATEVQTMRDTITSLQGQLDASNSMTTSLRDRIAVYEAKITTLEAEKNALVSKTHFLEGNQEAQSHEFTSMREKLEDAVAQKDATLDTLRKEEVLRRKLNAMILELRGNIRVFVRTRPLLNGEDDPAKVEYIDEDSLDGCKEMVVHAPTKKSATGKVINEKDKYGFDRIFTPGTSNELVFQECQDLIQSVVDGYNVSILSYGQTGSGKTYGMSGPGGIIPSSIGLLMAEMSRLKQKGWEYAVEASFVEVYNETLNDLLGDAKTWDDEDDLGASVRGKKKEKHEIHHDAVTGKTTVSNLTSVTLWPPPTSEADWPPAAPIDGDDQITALAPAAYTEKAVNNLLDTAAKNRRVAATKANERSSRSHSIFMLTLKGKCAATNESSEGVLNLVDLAGSERLKQSGAEGSRMKETQAINKSLSSLGDVIAALGNKSGNADAHVPYRNSKLTYLLQSSLGGTTAGKSSRTLMLLHLSPLQSHWHESKSSLGFGSKVHGTHIGAAKKR